MEILGKVVYACVILLAAPAAFLGLPAGVLVFFASLIFALFTHFRIITGWTLAVIGAVTIVSELADNWAQAAVSWRRGASPRAVGAAFLGSILGALILWPVAGLFFALAGVALGPLVGAAIAMVLATTGAMAGGWIAAYAAERKGGKETPEARRAAWGTVLGRAIGIFIKFALTLSMVVALLAMVF